MEADVGTLSAIFAGGSRTDGSGHYRLAIEDRIRGHLDRLRDRPKSDQLAYLQGVAGLLSRPLYAYRPLPMARRFHHSQKKIRFCLGGNRSSKSQSAAQEVMWFATGTHPWRQIETPNEGWYCTLTWELCGSILWKKLKKLLTGFTYRVAWHNKSRGIPEIVAIDIPGKSEPSRVIFKPYEQGDEAFQGTAQRWIANDEQFPQTVFTEQISRIGAEYPLDFWSPMTPIRPQPWLEEKLNGGDLPAGWDVFEFPLDDNRISSGGFIADQTIDAMISEWPVEAIPTRRYGKWGSFVGVVYQTLDRRIHVVNEERERAEFFPRDGHVPSNATVIGSIDWGGANPFVFLWVAQLPHLGDDWYAFDEYYWDPKRNGQRRLEEHADEIKARTLRWRTSLERSWADHDPTDVNEFANYGVPSSPADKDKSLGIETVRALLKVRADTGRPRLHIASRCRNLIKELASYRYPDGTKNNDPRNEPVKKDDHTCDALRYILHSEKAYSPIPDSELEAMPRGSRRTF